MARVYVALVSEPGSEAAAAAVARGLKALGELTEGPWSVLSPPLERLSRDERVLPSLVSRALPSSAGRPSVLRAVSRGADLIRYQLSVGHRGERIEAHAALHTTQAIAWVAPLSRDATLGGVGGALAAGAIHLLAEDLDAVAPEHRPPLLAGLLEVGDPDLVVGDGRRVAVGAGADAPRNHALGVMLIADNALAHDVVWAWILGLEPSNLAFLQLLAERGFGPGVIDDVQLLGDDPEEVRRRMLGFGVPGPLSSLSAAYQRALGVPLPVEVLPCDEGPAAARANAWLSAHTEHPARREELKSCPTFSLLAGPRAPGVVPTHDRVLAVGPEAAEAMLADVHVDRATQRSRSFLAAFVRRSSAAVWDLWLADGRQMRLVALDEVAPSAARIGRAAAMLTRRPGLAWPRESRIQAIRAWILRRLRRVRVPPPVVHARKILRLRSRPWRQAALDGPPLREPDGQEVL